MTTSPGRSSGRPDDQANPDPRNKAERTGVKGRPLEVFGRYEDIDVDGVLLFTPA